MRFANYNSVDSVNSVPPCESLHFRFNISLIFAGFINPANMV